MNAPNYYSIKPVDIKKGQVFFVRESGGHAQYTANSNAKTIKGICIVEVLDRAGYVNELKFNTSFESNVFVEHLDTNWKRIY